MKVLIYTIVILALLLLVGVKMRGYFSATITHSTDENSVSLYDLQTRTLTGEKAELDQYRGQVSLVVNTASKCGLTPQYEAIEALYRQYSEKGFVVLGFPSNDFMGQEPGTAKEIALFCSERYDITFPMFEKTKVKGNDRSEIFVLLSSELEEPSWNFTKYLVARDGSVVARFAPQIKPDDPQLLAAIEQELAVE